ncbi:hypothetical protein, partial [Rahnella perminowiae]|uniref:hypothetical protein n=1 Tax=Rahnella perminowiae TaxID=2816244 RepID=UPI001C2806C4
FKRGNVDFNIRLGAVSVRFFESWQQKNAPDYGIKRRGGSTLIPIHLTTAYNALIRLAFVYF